MFKLVLSFFNWVWPAIKRFLTFFTTAWGMLVMLGTGLIALIPQVVDMFASVLGKLASCVDGVQGAADGMGSQIAGNPWFELLAYCLAADEAVEGMVDAMTVGMGIVVVLGVMMMTLFAIKAGITVYNLIALVVRVVSGGFVSMGWGDGK